MAIRSKSSQAALALLLLALVAAPIAGEAFAAADLHACCPERAPVADAPLPCQYVAALECCAQLGLPATAAGDGPRSTQMAFVLFAFTPQLPPPPVLLFAQTRTGHGPPQGASLRATVLRL